MIIFTCSIDDVDIASAMYTRIDIAQLVCLTPASRIGIRTIADEFGIEVVGSPVRNSKGSSSINL